MKTNLKTPSKETQSGSGESSLARLLAQHSESVYRFCLRLCGGRTADAEDLAQDALVLSWQNRASFAGRSALTTWLMRIALNRHFRLRNKEGGISPLDEERDTGSYAVPGPAQQTVERLELADALDTLPPPLRAAFVLVKVEGLKYREAAEVLGVPQGTVQSQVHDAVMRLRTILSTPESLSATSGGTTPVPTEAVRNTQTPKEVTSHVL